MFVSARITGSAVRRSGAAGPVVAIDIDAEIVDDRRTEPWTGRYSFVGAELAALVALGPVARRAAIRQRVRDYLRETYRAWSDQIAVEDTPPEANDVSGIAAFTQAEIAG